MNFSREHTASADRAKFARPPTIVTQVAAGVIWGIQALDAGLTKPVRQKKGVTLEAQPAVDGAQILVRVPF